MRRFIRSYFFNSLALALIGWLYPGLEVSFQLEKFLLASLLLTLSFKVLKPILKILLLPLNLLTLGFFRWLKTVICLALTIYLAEGVSLTSFTFPGLKIGGLSFHSCQVGQFVNLLISSFLFTYSTKGLKWLAKTK